MPRGYPDWGRIKKETGIVAVGDLGELAVRLGSPMFYDRRGDAFFIDCFEEGLLRWAKDYGGPGAGVFLSCEYAQHGGYSAKLVGSSEEEYWTKISLDLQPLWPGCWGAECAFAYNFRTDKVVWYFYYGNGEQDFQFCIRHDRLDNSLEYYAEGAIWETFETATARYYGPPRWYNSKLVIDTSKGEYSRFMIGTREWDLRGKKPYTGAMVGDPYISVAFEIHSEPGYNGIMYVDSVIITFNEPE